MLGLTVAAVMLASLIISGGAAWKDRLYITQSLVDKLNREASCGGKCTQAQLIKYLNDTKPFGDDEYSRYKNSILNSGNLGEYNELVRMKREKMKSETRLAVSQKFSEIMDDVRRIPNSSDDFKDQLPLFPQITFRGSKLRGLMKRLSESGQYVDKLNNMLDELTEKRRKNRKTFKVLLFNDKPMVSDFLNLLKDYLYDNRTTLTDSQSKLYKRLNKLEYTLLT